MSRISLPSPSMVVALIALVLALGGTGYAAIKLPANSIGSGQLPAGAKGDKGDTGAQGLQGPKGDKGDSGQNGSLSLASATLASGQTERGAFGLGGPNGAAG